MRRYLDELREFIISYPDWGEFNILPPTGRFLRFEDVSMEWFQASANTTQLALEPNGSSIVGAARQSPIWSADILGCKEVTEQEIYTLYLLQSSGTSGERADTGEFLRHFKRWLMKMSIEGAVPMFGDVPDKEYTWATGGAKVADWEGSPPASVYSVQIHKQFVTRYETEVYF